MLTRRAKDFPVLFATVSLYAFVTENIKPGTAFGVPENVPAHRPTRQEPTAPEHFKDGATAILQSLIFHKSKVFR